MECEDREKEHFKVCFQRDKLDAGAKQGIHCSLGTARRKFISSVQTLADRQCRKQSWMVKKKLTTTQDCPIRKRINFAQLKAY